MLPSPLQLGRREQQHPGKLGKACASTGFPGEVAKAHIWALLHCPHSEMVCNQAWDRRFKELTQFSYDSSLNENPTRSPSPSLGRGAPRPRAHPCPLPPAPPGDSQQGRRGCTSENVTLPPHTARGRSQSCLPACLLPSCHPLFG